MQNFASLSDLCELIVDCPHSTPVWTEIGVPVLRNQNIRYGRLDLSNPSFTDEEHYQQRIHRATPRTGDLVITREAPMGEVCMIPEGLRCCLGQRMVLLRPDSRKCDGRFLLYALQSPKVQHEISVNEGTGSTVSNVRIPLLKALRIPSPPLMNQHAIASILGTLDDKIELNRRMNETLEAMARAIFKSWFVDFDPVRAKAEGYQPEGLDADTAALFPASFEDSELGEIPVGWNVRTVSSIADLNARTLGGNDHLDILDYIEIGKVLRGEVYEVTRYARGTEPSRAKRRLTHGDTVISTVRPDRGAYFLCLNPSDTLVASTGFVVATPKSGSWAFLHAALTRPEVGEELGLLADGGAYPAIRPEVISGISLVTPQNQQIVDEYERFSQGLFEKADRNRKASLVIATIRDALLPKLLSGEIRVKEVERFLEA